MKKFDKKGKKIMICFMEYPEIQDFQDFFSGFSGFSGFFRIFRIPEKNPPCGIPVLAYICSLKFSHKDIFYLGHTSLIWTIKYLLQISGRWFN